MFALFLQFRKMATHVMKFVHFKPCTESPIPEARSGHRIVTLNGSLYCIGGFNPKFWEIENDDDTNYPLFRELWRYNIATRTWKKLKTRGHMPKELASHAALLLGHHLVVMGGTGVPFGDTASNRLHACDLKTLQWQELECYGDLPTPSYGHAIVAVENTIYTFGGTTGWHYNADVHSIHLRNKSWNLINTAVGDVPEGRYRHEMAYHKGRLFIFGGGRSNLSYRFHKIPVFDIAKNEWEKKSCHPDPKHGFPYARRCHGCVQWKDSVYICGGYNGDKINDDLWMLNLFTLRWVRLPATMPEPAYFHSVALTEMGCLLVYGGVTKVDDERTSNIYAIWLEMPTLRELCWQNIIKTNPTLHTMKVSRLQEAGIPRDLISRLS